MSKSNAFKSTQAPLSDIQSCSQLYGADLINSFEQPFSTIPILNSNNNNAGISGPSSGYHFQKMMPLPSGGDAIATDNNNPSHQFSLNSNDSSISGSRGYHSQVMMPLPSNDVVATDNFSNEFGLKSNNLSIGGSSSYHSQQMMLVPSSDAMAAASDNCNLNHQDGLTPETRLRNQGHRRFFSDPTFSNDPSYFGSDFDVVTGGGGNNVNRISGIVFDDIDDETLFKFFNVNESGNSSTNSSATATSSQVAGEQLNNNNNNNNNAINIFRSMPPTLPATPTMFEFCSGSGSGSGPLPPAAPTMFVFGSGSGSGSGPLPPPAPTRFEFDSGSGSKASDQGIFCVSPSTQMMENCCVHPHSQLLGKTPVCAARLEMNAYPSIPPYNLLMVDNRRKHVTFDELAAISQVNPGHARRILANRRSAARLKERKERYKQVLEDKVRFLNSRVNALHLQLEKTKRELSHATAENKKLEIQMEAMRQHSQLKGALNDVLNGEIKHLKQINMRAVNAGIGILMGQVHPDPLAFLMAQQLHHLHLNSQTQELEQQQQQQIQTLDSNSASNNVGDALSNDDNNERN